MLNPQPLIPQHPTTFLLVTLGFCLLIGCDAPSDKFPPNKVFLARMERTQQVALDAPAQDIDGALEAIFGTPDEPKWVVPTPSSASPIVQVDSLKRAAGAVRSDEADLHFGLYREHCVACHGVSGDGTGPASRLLSPYPRDFRLGKFKFKSTPIGKKPTKSDLRRVLTDGIAGTSMPSFRLLKSDELEALVDYVVYLSVRGETERQLISYAANELDLDANERLYDPSLSQTNAEQYASRWKTIENFASTTASQWESAAESSLQVPEPPPGLPIFGVLLTLDLDADQESLLNASVQRGRQLFAGPIANCVSCHGPTGLGDGQKNNYDTWTKDWTEGLDPQNRDEIRPFLKLGALKPQFISPRNLRLGIYRGGSEASDLYLRIVNGIEGTPMPAVAMMPDNPQGLSSADVWDLVNFLLSLPHDDLSRDAGIVPPVASVSSLSDGAQ